MDKALFNKFRDIVYEKSGIYLKDGKETLVSARLAKRMRTLGIPDYQQYFEYIINDKNGNETVQFIDAISTNVTSFFRDKNHFDFLRPRISEWAAKGQRRFRFWSAGCSSGEEPYSLAISFLETLRDMSPDMKILATDISTRILAQAGNGVYTEKKLGAVPKYLKGKYFTRKKEGGEYQFTANSMLKKHIVFRRLNLSAPPFPMSGPLDAIFCRNVMIYFDENVRTPLIHEFSRLLRPDGYLIVGPSESLTGIVSDFRPVQPSIYTKRG